VFAAGVGICLTALQTLPETGQVALQAQAGRRVFAVHAGQPIGDPLAVVQQFLKGLAQGCGGSMQLPVFEAFDGVVLKGGGDGGVGL